MSKLNSSSFSRAEAFEKCPYFFKLRHIDKIPDPRPEDIGESPLDRGSRLHDLAERYVDGRLRKFPEELVLWKERLDKIKKLHQRGIVVLEERLAFDELWNPVAYDDWANALYRMVADVRILPNDEQIIIIDYKSGRKDGNEVKHHSQAMEYATGYALLYPTLQEFTTQLYYFDQPQNTSNPTIKTFTRERVLRNFARMQKRHNKVIHAEFYPAHPSQNACRFCPYKAGLVGSGKNSYPGTGHCRKNVC